MNFIRFILNWVNIFSFIILIQGIYILLGKNIPIYAKKKLEGETLESWSKIHFLGDVISAIGFYCFTLTKNLYLYDLYELTINLIGLILIPIGIIIKIINNKKNIGKWSSSM